MAFGTSKKKKLAETNSGKHCDLLFAVYPAFVDALPTKRLSTSLQDDNYITLLRYEILTISEVFNVDCTEHELSDEAFRNCTESLNVILELFERLVAETIGHGMSLCCEELYAAFPKLVALKDRISKGELRPDSNLISFGTVSSLRLPTLVAQNFNEKMSKIFSEINNELDVSNLQTIQESAEPDMAPLRQAEQLCEASGYLFGLLQEAFCRKRPEEHKAHIRLSQFEEQKLEMMLSICECKNLWQQVHIYKGFESREDQIENICPVLQQSRGRKLLSMEFNDKGIRKRSNTDIRRKASAKSPTETLRQILKKEEESRRQSEIGPYRTIKKKHKRRLGLLLATALLHLYGSPLLQRTLNADTIYIRHGEGLTDGQDSIPEAYISCAFSSELIEQPGNIEEPVPGDPFVLALATLLMELELEKEVIVLDIDIDEISQQRSLYMAVTRLQDALSEGLEDMDPFPNIIESCLQIYDEIKDTGGKDYHRKLRRELFTKVVDPLNQRDKAISNPGKSIEQPSAAFGQGTISWPNYSSTPSYLPMETIRETAKEDTVVQSVQRSSSTSSNLLATGSVNTETDISFTIAIVCALSLEYDALAEILDGEPQVLPHDKDQFIYTTGVLAGQKVVIAFPKNPGPLDAALAVQWLENKYGTMELIILLGICAGVPTPLQKEGPIYLADVIIGTDVLAYAHGARKNSAGLKLRNITLGKAGWKIQNMLHLLKTDAYARKLWEKSSKTLSQLSFDNPGRYGPLPEEDDLYFDPFYHHLHHSHCPDNECDARDPIICHGAEETSCQKLQCDMNHLARHRPSYETWPSRIHYGVYASADMVMRDAKVRDYLAKTHKIIAFDMEATGIWDVSPHVLVIKGVCDYGDSHKTKQWQDRAAAHAACTAKAFVEIFFPLR